MANLLDPDRVTSAFSRLAADDETRAAFLLRDAACIPGLELTDCEVQTLKRLLPHLDRALTRAQAKLPDHSPSGASPFVADSDPDSSAVATGDVDHARVFINGSFSQLRTAFVLTLVMSSVVFSLGVVFLAVAAYGVAAGTADAAETAVVGGIGVAQIATLFFTRPLQTVERAVANAQQARLVIMTYMLQVGSLGERMHHARGSVEDAEALQQYTDKAVLSLQQYTKKAQGTG